MKLANIHMQFPNAIPASSSPMKHVSGGSMSATPHKSILLLIQALKSS